MINDKHFYTDDGGINYYSCNINNDIAHCDECSSRNTCNKFENGYVLQRSNIYECIEEGLLTNDNHFFTKDSGITYYSCSLFNSVANCAECSNGNTCDKCLDDYGLYNDNKLCLRETDINNNLYVRTNTGLFAPCFSLIQNCKKCSNEETCIECQDRAGLTENNACVNEAMVEENHEYYKDENNRYVRCSIMDHCLTCSSASVCTSCQEGFNLNNNQCNESVEEDSGLSKGAIVGIILGSILFSSILFGFGYFIYRKYKYNKKDYQKTYDIVEISEQKTERNKNKGNQTPNTEKQNSEECVVYKRRSVSNKK